MKIQRRQSVLTENWIHVPVSATHYYSGKTDLNPRLADVWIKDLEDHGVIPVGKVKSRGIDGTGYKSMTNLPSEY